MNVKKKLDTIASTTKPFQDWPGTRNHKDNLHFANETREKRWLISDHASSNVISSSANDQNRQKVKKEKNYNEIWWGEVEIGRERERETQRWIWFHIRRRCCRRRKCLRGSSDWAEKRFVSIKIEEECNGKEEWWRVEKRNDSFPSNDEMRTVDVEINKLLKLATVIS